jgi:hypothetical protein
MHFTGKDLLQLIEKDGEFNKDMVIVFIEFEKTVENMKREKIGLGLR